MGTRHTRPRLQGTPWGGCVHFAPQSRYGAGGLPTRLGQLGLRARLAHRHRPLGPCRAGHTAGTRHTRAPRESTPRGPPAGRNARVPREVTHHQLCRAPRNHTVPSSPCPFTADFANFLIFMYLFIILAALGLCGCGGFPWLQLTASRAPAEGSWRTARSLQGQRGPAAVPSQPAGSQDGVCEPVLGALAGKLRGDGCPCRLKHGVRRTGHPKPAGLARAAATRCHTASPPAGGLGSSPFAAPFSAASFEGHPLTLCFSGAVLRKEWL